MSLSVRQLLNCNRCATALNSFSRKLKGTSLGSSAYLGSNSWFLLLKNSLGQLILVDKSRLTRFSRILNIILLKPALLTRLSTVITHDKPEIAFFIVATNRY